MLMLKKNNGPAFSRAGESDCRPLPENKKISLCLRVALLTAAVLLIIAGILNGSALDVLVKAINICTECIGLG